MNPIIEINVRAFFTCDEYDAEPVLTLTTNGDGASIAPAVTNAIDVLRGGVNLPGTGWRPMTEAEVLEYKEGEDE